MTRKQRLDVTPLKNEDDKYIRANELDATTRKKLERFTTPRRALDDSLVYLVDEVKQLCS